MKIQLPFQWWLLVTSLWLVKGDPQPVLTADNHGHVVVRVPDVPGTVSVTLTLVSGTDRTEQGVSHSITITQKSVDGSWRYRLPVAISKGSKLYYLLEYHFPDSIYRVNGSQPIDVLQGRSSLATQAPSLSSVRYLRRRATTVLFDDFSSGHIDLNKWTYITNAGWYENLHEAQMYTKEPVNSYVRNGILYIRPTLTVDTFGQDILTHGTIDARARWGCTGNWGPCVAHARDPNMSIRPIMSAMLRSKGEIRYGKVEIVAKMAVGDWFWSALWMMPSTSFYGAWPASGEIDLTECAGNRHYTNLRHLSTGIDRMMSSIHFGVDRNNHVYDTDEYRLTHGNFGSAWHKYWVDWTEQYIVIGVDEHVVYTLNTPPHGFYQATNQHGRNVWMHGGHNAPFDKPFYLLMNVHAGGNPFEDDHWTNHPYDRPWNPKDSDYDQMVQFWNARHLWEPTWQGETAAMQVKSVKMEQY